MSELREDPITHDWVIINPERAKRPEDTSAQFALWPFLPRQRAPHARADRLFHGRRTLVRARGAEQIPRARHAARPGIAYGAGVYREKPRSSCAHLTVMQKNHTGEPP